MSQLYPSYVIAGSFSINEALLQNFILILFVTFAGTKVDCWHVASEKRQDKGFKRLFSFNWYYQPLLLFISGSRKYQQRYYLHC